MTRKNTLKFSIFPDAALGFGLGVLDYVLMAAMGLLVLIPVSPLLLFLLYIPSLLLKIFLLRKKSFRRGLRTAVFLLLGFTLCFFINTSFLLLVRLEQALGLVSTPGSEFFAGLSLVLFLILNALVLLILLLIPLLRSRRKEHT